MQGNLETGVGSGLPPEYHREVQRLRAVLRSGSHEDWFEAVWTLRQVGEDVGDAVHALIRALADADPRVALNAADALFVVDDAGAAIQAVFDRREFTVDVLDRLLAGLGHNEPPHRQRAAFELGMYGKRAEAAVPQLSALVVGDTDEMVQAAAIAALNRIDPSGAALKATGYVPETSESLAAKPAAFWIARLSSPYVGSRIGAAESLGRLHEAAGADGVAALIRALDDENDDVRYTAAQSLAWIGALAAPALPKLESMAGGKVDEKRITPLSDFIASIRASSHGTPP